eukprot:jgi/Orpsp1_1/1181939/evm.model.c7180000079204.1
MLYSNQNLLDKKVVNEPFPKITNPEVMEAMTKLKEIKNEFGEHGILSNNNDIMNCLNSDKCLFVKAKNNLNYFGNYTLSNLPGNIEGISGSCIGGYNIGINKYITEEKKEKAARVLEYISSMEFQQNIIMKSGFQSALGDIFEYDSICQEFEQCRNFKTIQAIVRPTKDTDDYTLYSQKYRNYLLKYLFNDEDLKECLQNIEYLTIVSYEEDSSGINKFFMILVGATDLIMIYCYLLAFTKKHRYKFRLLNRFYWFVYMIGEIIIIGYGFTCMGKLTDFKCQIKAVIFSIGFTLSNTVLLIRILINFPESDRRFVRFCEKHFFLCVLISLVIDVLLNILVLREPYGATVIINDNIMLYKCKMYTTFGIVALLLLYSYKVLILIFIAILIFIEWNMIEFRYDIHYATSILFLSFFAFFLFGMFQYVNFKGYKERFIIPSLVIYFYGVSCFGIYFVTRFFSKYNDDDNSDEKIVKNAKLTPSP